MGFPSFLLRKLYRRGSLTPVAGGFRFTLQNPLATATIVAPPRFVINGVQFTGAQVDAVIDLGALTAAKPFVFERGTSLDLQFAGALLRGANRIQIEAETDEFGLLEIFVEDRLRSDDSEE
ncbi:MAG: hypothetical protein ACPHID_05675 [Thermoplasmatota archaeon]